MIGIICKDDVAALNPSLFLNFRLGLTNYLKTKFVEVSGVDDLKDITTLIIVDEHFGPHVCVWKNDKFIAQLNNCNIKTLVFNFEKIFTSKFPWNIDHQQKLETINNLYQFVSDVDDAANFKKDIINKQLLSKDTKLEHAPVEKKNRILFIGQSDPTYNPSWSYSRRFNVLNDLRNRSDLPLDICITDRKLSYKEFLTKLASYKFILNPLGTGDFINVRFYEALKLGCVPIQQVTDNMLNAYSELSSNICYNFKIPNEVQLPNDSFNKFNYYLEDYFEEINLKNYI
tara:strand:+ start:1015 stop:1872 length:858 start_codon:yes stop_codon:yes gene_type:complete